MPLEQIPGLRLFQLIVISCWFKKYVEDTLKIDLEKETRFFDELTNTYQKN